MCEVVRSNFEDILPRIESAIAKADFISVDTEFSGLIARDEDHGSLFDSGEDRYRKLRHSVSQFTVTQIGLSMFLRDESLENTYMAHTFNLYLYPVAFAVHDVKFLCQASSWQFLCRYKFDFNKYIYSGISFLNNEQEQLLVSYLHGSEKVDDRVRDERVLQESCSVVARWIVQAKDDEMMLLDETDGVGDYYIMIELRQRFPQIWTEFINGKIQVTRVSTEERQKFNVEYKRQEEERIVKKLLGFTRVFRLMVEHKKPLLGHNNLMDLMFIYDKFYQSLPQSYSKFKADIHEMFPIVIDTKHISNSIRQSYEETGLFQETSLSELYTSLDSSKGRLHTICSPNIGHATGFDRYRNVSVPHEAGFDAYMCGYVFIRIAHILAHSGIKSTDARVMSHRDYLRAVGPFINSVNVIRASVDSIRLASHDLPPRFPQWLYVQARNSKQTLSNVELAKMFAQFGSVDIRVNDSNAAFVAIKSQKTAKDILVSFRDNKTIHVARYNFWKHSSLVRSTIWLGAVVSGTVAVWAVVSGLRNKPT